MIILIKRTSTKIMDHFENIHTMSIAELRKFLSDNEVSVTSESKEELIEQVSNVIQTNMIIESLMQQDIDSFQTGSSLKTKERDPQTLEREKQDVEYYESLQNDLQFTSSGDYIIEQPEQSTIDDFSELEEPLSPNSLRHIRLLRFDTIA